MDELERNWYHLARRTQQLERKMFVKLLEGEPWPALSGTDTRELLRTEAFKHSEYFPPGSSDNASLSAPSSPLRRLRNEYLHHHRIEALPWALQAFRTRDRVSFGTRHPIVHFAALWAPDRLIPWNASRTSSPARGFYEAVEKLRAELIWAEPGDRVSLVVTHHYTEELTATRLSHSLWCAMIPIPQHAVDPALIEELVRQGQWRGVEMARFDLRHGMTGALQLLYRQSELDELAEVLMLGARLNRESEPDEYLLDVMLNEHKLPWPTEATEEDSTPEPSELKVLQQPAAGESTSSADDPGSATREWLRNMEIRRDLQGDTRLDPRWHGFADRFAQQIRSLEETFGGGRWGTLPMTCYSATHGFDGDQSPQVRISKHLDGWYCEVRLGTDDRGRARPAGVGIVPKGWGRGFGVVGGIYEEARDDTTWANGRLFAAGTSPFEVVHEMLLVLTLIHGVSPDDFFALDGYTSWFAEDAGVQQVPDSWLIRIAPNRSAVSSPTEASEESTEARGDEIYPTAVVETGSPIRAFEFQVDDDEVAHFRCRATSADEARAAAARSGHEDALLMADEPIDRAEQTLTARAAALADPLLGPSWAPLIDALAVEIDGLAASQPRVVQTYGMKYRLDPRISPYFQFLRQSDGTVLAEVTGMRNTGPASSEEWPDRLRLLGWRWSGDSIAAARTPMLREEATSPNPTKRFGAHQSGYSIVRSVLSLVTFSWEIDTADLFALVGHDEVFDAAPGLERVNGGKPIFEIRTTDSE